MEVYSIKNPGNDKYILSASPSTNIQRGYTNLHTELSSEKNMISVYGEKTLRVKNYTRISDYPKMIEIAPKVHKWFILKK
jgi:hypothetical protein